MHTHTHEQVSEAEALKQFQGFDAHVYACMHMHIHTYIHAYIHTSSTHTHEQVSEAEALKQFQGFDADVYAYSAPQSSEDEFVFLRKAGT
jgi:hypothetical protein